MTRSFLAALLVAAAVSSPGLASNELGLAAPPSHAQWMDLNDALREARRQNVPVLLWVSPCRSCGKRGFEDPDVVSMLPDFVTAWAGSATARDLGLPEDRAHALLLDVDGAPIEDLLVSAKPFEPLPSDELIDLMSSGLDVVR